MQCKPFVFKSFWLHMVLILPVGGDELKIEILALDQV
jgi:hypothetical protein